MAKRTRMTNVDAAWLQMESPTNLMMITGVITFETPVDYAALQAVLEIRLLEGYPRFRQRVVRPGFQFGNLFWEDDPHFDIAAHLHHIALPEPGDQHALQRLASTVMSMPLDMGRPLWHFYLVDGYRGGSAVIVRLHHCIADGIALARVFLSLVDPEPDENGAEAAQPEVAREKRSRLPGPILAMESALRTARKAADRVMHEGMAIAENPELLQQYAAQGVDGLAALNKLVLSWPDPQTRFKGELGVSKRAVWTTPRPLEEVKKIGRLTGCTVNDVLVGCVTGALRRYLAAHGEEVENFRAAVPVNLRPTEGPIALGNQFGLVFLPLPVGMADPIDRILEVKQRMDAIKNSPEAIVALGLLNVIGLTPPVVEKQIMRLFGSKVTSVMTNVPGPRQPVNMAGSRIRSLIFWVPQSGGLGLGISIFSYNNRVILGIASDAGLVPDPEQITAFFDAEFEELLALVNGQDA
jgi:WS/DGAT/MGAT family acyltransferase